MQARTYVSLREKKKTFFVERRLFYFNLMAAIFEAAILRFPWLLVTNALIHLVAAWASSKHPHLVEIYKKYRHQGDRYRPWVSPSGWLRNRRPEGFHRL